MWTVLRLALFAAVSAASVAHAASQSIAGQGSVDPVVQQATAAAKAQRPAPEPGQARQLQFGNFLSLVQPALRAEIGASDGAALRSSSQVAVGFTTRTALPRWLAVRGAQPTLAYAISKWMSLGVRYSYLRSEDLVFRVAKVGALSDEYQNHKLMVSAQWEF